MQSGLSRRAAAVNANRFSAKEAWGHTRSATRPPPPNCVQVFLRGKQAIGSDQAARLTQQGIERREENRSESAQEKAIVRPAGAALAPELIQKRISQRTISAGESGIAPPLYPRLSAHTCASRRAVIWSEKRKLGLRFADGEPASARDMAQESMAEVTKSRGSVREFEAKISGRVAVEQQACPVRL